MTGISSLFPAFPKQMSILDRVKQDTKMTILKTGHHSNLMT